MKHAEKKHEDGEELFMQEDEAKEQGTPKRSPEIINAQIELKELEKQREAAATKLQSVQRARMSRRIVIARLKEAQGRAEREEEAEKDKSEILQYDLEKRLAKEELVTLQMLREAAAIKLQSLQRARMSRRTLLFSQMEEGIKGLSAVKLRKEKQVQDIAKEEESRAQIELKELEKQREAAAIKLQSAQRALIARKSMTVKLKKNQGRECQHKRNENDMKSSTMYHIQAQAKAQVELEKLQKLQEAAATKLQSLQRGRISRKTIRLEQEHSRAQIEEAEKQKQEQVVEKLRRDMEEREAQAELEQLQKLQERAAIKLQSLQRAYSSRLLVIAKRKNNIMRDEEENRHAYDERREEDEHTAKAERLHHEEAVIKLQCLWRVYASRRSAKAKRKAKEQTAEDERLRIEEEEERRVQAELKRSRELREAAATKIQSLRRVLMSRKAATKKRQLKALEESESQKRSLARQTEIEEYHKVQSAAATKFQSLVRGHLSRKIFVSNQKEAKSKSMAELVESNTNLRREEEQKARAELEQIHKLEEAAATKLQSLYRAKASRKKVAALRRDIAKVVEDLEAERKFAEEAEKYRKEAERLRQEESANSLENMPPVSTPVKVIKKASLVTVSVKQLNASRSKGNERSSQDGVADSNDPHSRSPSSVREYCSYDSRDDNDDYSYSSLHQIIVQLLLLL